MRRYKAKIGALLLSLGLFALTVSPAHAGEEALQRQLDQMRDAIQTLKADIARLQARLDNKVNQRNSRQRTRVNIDMARLI